MTTFSDVSCSYEKPPSITCQHFPGTFVRVLVRINALRNNLLDTASAAVEVLPIFVNLHRPWFPSRLYSCATAVSTTVRRTILRRVGIQFCVQPVFLICECFLHMPCLVTGMWFLICILNVVGVPVPPSTSHFRFWYSTHTRVLSRFSFRYSRYLADRPQQKRQQISDGDTKQKHIESIYLLPPFSFLSDDPSQQQQQQQQQQQ